jgi:precorrin-2 dehydrogenase / sirohydrochlorin ferrochelatase
VAYFPLFMDLKNESCVVIGGGMVAYRKIKALLEFEAKVTAVAPKFCDDISDLAKTEDKLIYRLKKYELSDIKEAFLVIAATDDFILNKKIAEDCRKKKIPVNVVDRKEECSFIFPAYIKKGDITIGVTTSGKSPVISGKLKNSIEKIIPDFLPDLVAYLGNIREKVKASVTEEDIRKKVLFELAESGYLNKGKLKTRDLEKIMKEAKLNKAQDRGGSGEENCKNRHKEK